MRALIAPVDEPALHVMSWNVRRSSASLTLRSTNRWPRRAPRIRALLQLERPALLGAQEVLPGQLPFLQESLGDGYRVLGSGRSADGGDEACPILYDERRLDLQSWRQLALSDRPAQPGSMGWGNVLPRVVVSAVFTDRVTGHPFHAVTTHLDAFSRRARLRSARAIGQLVAGTALPALVLGDLNDDADSATLRELRAGGCLRDTWQTAQQRVGEDWGTFANYRRPRCGGRRLDWILASPNIRVRRAGIDPRRVQDGWPSDHLPVHAVVELPPAGPGRPWRGEQLQV